MDNMSSEQRHRTMSRIRSKDTKAEILLRKALWGKGYRYRKNLSSLPGKPDIVLTKHKICVFVDGEFFHGKHWNSGQRDRILNGNRAEYWIPKIEKNMKRDRDEEDELKRQGWKVLRFWSKDVIKDTNKCVSKIEKVIFDQ